MTEIVINNNWFSKWYVQIGLIWLLKWVNANWLPNYFMKVLVSLVLFVSSWLIIAWWIYKKIDKINEKMLGRFKK